MREIQKDIDFFQEYRYARCIYEGVCCMIELIIETNTFS